ncbi:MAG: aminopeptidase P family protein [Clostridia bacterium]|nr:aminopeptidase P family protein [Clostridia bacterium]
MSRIERLRAVLPENTAAYITAYPDIFYYSGFQSEDARLIISAKKAIIITDSRYTLQARVQAPEFELYDIKNGLKGAFELVSEEKILFQEENLSVKSYNALCADICKKTFEASNGAISKPREIKDSGEIAKIRAAEELGDRAFSYILERIAVGRQEREIALELEFFMRQNGASGLSFETIAASGVRSAMPHGVASDKVIEKGDLLTLDFGCVLDGYCSDMTRTVAVGELSERAREIYEVVKKAQQTALDVISEGVKLSAVDKAARDVIRTSGYGENFGHALGHSVGIEIHENPCFSPRAEGVVQKGNVITVEPGIYIDGFGGVRIEDVVAITEKGTEILSKSTKELIIL